MAKRYDQEEGIDYDEMFDLMTALEVTGILLALALHADINLCQINVKCAFLNSYL